MFRDHATAEGRPLITKLQNRTYVHYRQAWMKLLIFIYRTSLETFDSKLKTALRFRLTKLQRRKLESARQIAVAMDDSLPFIAADESAFNRAKVDARRSLDRVIVHLSLSLLKQTIAGGLFNAVVPSFLAVLGLNGELVSFSLPDLIGRALGNVNS